MKRVAAILSLITFMLLLVLPASAHSTQQSATVTKTFELVINGEVPQVAARDAFGVVYTYATPAGQNQIAFIHFCGILGGSAPKANCTGNGTVYKESVVLPAGVVLGFSFFRQVEGQSVMGGAPAESFLQGQETITTERTNVAVYDFNSKVTKTHQLTLNGEVPAGQAFFVEQVTADGRVVQTVMFCGRLPRGHVLGAVPSHDCTGNGTVYTQSVLLDRGATFNFSFRRYDGSDPTGEPFYEVTETLSSDMTNTANFIFERATPDNDGAPPTQLPDTGAAAVATIIAALAALTLAIGQRLVRWVKGHK